MSWQPPAPGSPGGPGGYGGPPGYPVPPPGYPVPPPGYPPPSGYPPFPGYPMGAYALQGPPGPATGLVYAGFWWRVLGYLLDALIIGIPTGVIRAILAVSLQWTPTTVCPNGFCNGIVPTTYNGLPLGPAVGYGVCLAVIDALYFGVLVGRWGSTVGQRAVGARVVREEAPAHSLPMDRALVRSAVFSVAAILESVVLFGGLAVLGLFLCLLWVAWDPRKQGLHDKLGRAIVVRRSGAPVLVPMTALNPYQPPYAPPYPSPALPPQPPQGPPAGWGP